MILHSHGDRKNEGEARGKARGPADRLALVVATFFGVGYAPVAPGTCGTLATVPVALALGRLGSIAFAAAALAATLVGIWAAGRAVRVVGRHDPGCVVIDEVAGYLIALVAVERDGLHLALAFVLFRVLDIWKPGPIRTIDRRVMGGLGVVLDDVAAGVVAAVALRALDLAGGTAWIARALGL